MKRRDLFKMIGTLAAGAVAAPLAKLKVFTSTPTSQHPRDEWDPIHEWDYVSLKKLENLLPVSEEKLRDAMAKKPLPTGGMIRIRMPQRYVIRDWENHNG